LPDRPDLLAEFGRLRLDRRQPIDKPVHRILLILPRILRHPFSGRARIEIAIAIVKLEQFIEERRQQALAMIAKMREEE
jgi:hypothetical protein